MKISRREVLTIPNGLTLIRALGVPIFLWLLLGENLKGWSYLVLAIGAWTDYFDGKVARWLHQESKLGAAMDPTIDRLYIGRDRDWPCNQALHTLVDGCSSSGS
ncbi:MAG: CDP-alcohol phosphatidyltransferase family protein [Actinomycetota bacterium]